jgi:DNA-binding GntR family transcriptional regulator
MTALPGDLLISAQEAAHRWLREMIFSGALQSGQALRQEDIARRLGISRLPIREALSRLATEGLVELKPRRGFYVTSLNVDEIEDIFEMRAMLEARAGQLAAENVTPADADAVDELVAELDTVVVPNARFERYAELNVQFHERLYQSCGRKHLRRQIAMLRDAVSPLIRILASETGELQRAHEEHRLLAKAYRRGDAERVAALSREHIDYTARALIQKLGSGALTDGPSSEVVAAARRQSA